MMVETIHEKARRLEADVARLREALLKVWNFSARYARDESGKRIMHCPLCKLRVGHEEDCPFAALATPADDWLEQHDAEVRREERERCTKAVVGTCLECGGIGKILILVDVGRTEEMECARCSVLTAAIREQEADDERV